MAAGVGHLALLSGCRTAALVTLGGAVEWWPGGRFDGPSVFSRLLDPDAVLGEDGLHRRLEGRDGEGAFVPATSWLAACRALAADSAEVAA